MTDRFAPRGARVLLAIGVLIPVLASCRTESADAASSSRLEASFFDDRFSLGRLVGQATWQPCVGGDSLEAASRCSTPRLSVKTFDRLAHASRLSRQRLDSDSSAQALHDAALLALRLRDSITTGLDDAARFLARARRIAPADRSILNDFAVVQLELGEREQSIRPFLAALDAAELALTQDSSLAPALFNRALALERMHLLTTARRAWMTYVNAERDPAWRREARVHMSLLAREAKSAMLPQGGRDTVFHLLGEWGHAVGRGDETAAASLLQAAHAIAATLDTLHGDQSVRLAVALVDSGVRSSTRSDRGRTALRRLAAAHAELSDGLLAHKRASYLDAERQLGNASLELRALGSPAAGWGALYQASEELNRGEYDAADGRLQQVIAEASAQQPALAGKAVWTRGVNEVRRGNFETANRFYLDARPYLARSNEPENEGAISYLISENLSYTGQYAAGPVEAYRGLRLLAPYRKSNFLNNHLGTVAAYARADSLRHAALTVMDEVLDVALGLGKADALALAYRGRARDLVSLGLRDSALAELTTAVQATGLLEGQIKARYRADIQLVQGEIERIADPQRGLTLLAEVARDYQSLGVHLWQSAACYQAAVAARDAGDTVQARMWLREAIAQIERQQVTFETSEGRAALFETADNAFDAMIDLELRAGHTDTAFVYLERERAAAKLASVDLSADGRAREAPSLQSIRKRLSTNEVFVEYALLPDRAIAWTASRRGISHHVIPAPRDTIAMLVQRFLGETTIPAAHDGDARSRLFDLLLRPLAGDLEGAAEISVVPDRELARLPFAALWDRTTHQYAVERYRVRTEPSAAFVLATQSLTSKLAQHQTALIVGNPAMDTASLRLDLLPGAEREAQSVAALYHDATLLTGAAAQRDAVLSLLQTSGVFHFAGHAVFNGDRPELSYLALAAPRDGSGSGVLEARDIGKLRLPNLKIVVLSACQTLSSRTSRTGGVAGLAASFLRAGAPAIVSTLWDVSDDVTGKLVATFHQRLAAGAPAAEALRAAQLNALESRTGQRTAPAIWAAFIYAGP